MGRQPGALRSQAVGAGNRATVLLGAALHAAEGPLSRRRILRAAIGTRQNRRGGRIGAAHGAHQSKPSPTRRWSPASLRTARRRIRRRALLVATKVFGSTPSQRGRVMRSSWSSIASAAFRSMPHIAGDGCRERHTAGRSGWPKIAHAWSSPRCTHGIPAGLPYGMPGIGEEIDGAMQQAPQPARHSISAFLRAQHRMDRRGVGPAAVPQRE